MTVALVGSAPFYTVAAGVGVPGAPVTLTRPNNAVAYAAGQVFGPAGDARAQFTAPALPAGAAGSGFRFLTIVGVDTRPPADAALATVRPVFSVAPFATVLGDQQLLALSDADIANLIPAVQSSWWPTSFVITTGAGQPVGLNQSAGVAGRRGFGFQVSMHNLSFLIPPGMTIGFYFMMSAAYAPIANESWILTPRWIYQPKRTL